MANTVVPTNGTHQRQERYSNAILKLLRKRLVTNEEDIFGTDYEGNPTAGAVKVPVRDTEVTVRDYDIASGVALEQSATTYLTIPIDSNKAVNEIIDGYEASAVPDNLVAQRLDSASYSMALNLDDDAIAVLESEGTTSTNTTQSTKTTAYDNFLTENVALDTADVPLDMRWGIVSPAFYALIKQDTAFVNAASDAGFNEVKKAGLVGMLDGIPIYKSNNLASDTEFIIGSKFYAQKILEFSVAPTINNLTNTYIGSSAVQGRYVYKHTVTRATAVRVKTYV